MKTKVCPRCSVEKELSAEHFHRNKGRPNGFNSDCRLCMAQRYRERVEREPDYCRKLWQKAKAGPFYRKAKAAWIAANRDRTRRYAKEFKLRHGNQWREKQRAVQAARRANGCLDGSRIRALVEQLTRSQGGCCAYCGAEAPLTIEHIVPVSRGGTNERGNLILVCRPCNSSKGARLLSEWSGRANGGDHL